jgi:hypothetical protein
LEWRRGLRKNLLTLGTRFYVDTSSIGSRELADHVVKGVTGWIAILEAQELAPQSQ